MCVFQVEHRNDNENHSLLRFNSLWEEAYRHDSLLVFSTGRVKTMYKKLRKERPLLTPDVIVTSVGTEISYGKSMVPDENWVEIMNNKWNRGIVEEETRKFPELTLQVTYFQLQHTNKSLYLAMILYDNILINPCRQKLSRCLTSLAFTLTKVKSRK